MINVRDFGALGDGVHDDRPAIQQAIDSVSMGDVYFPAGTYVLGSAGVVANLPLYLHSGISLVGDGAGISTIKVCDNARQLSEHPQYSYALNACIATVRSSPWWFVNPSSTVRGIKVRALTLDGNRNNQPAIFTRGNRTSSPSVPDPGYGINATAVSQPGSLLPPGTYNVLATYTDNAGNETGVGKNYASPYPIDSGQILRVALSPTPSGAVGVVLYVRRTIDNDAATNPVYERQGPFLLAATGTIDVTSHVPGLLYPPGTETINFYGNSSSSTGLWLENTSDVELSDVEIMNFVTDGIDLIDQVSDVRLLRCRFHDDTRAGVALTGAIDSVAWEDCDFRDSGAGISSETPAAMSRLRVVRSRFQRCRMAVGHHLMGDQVSTSFTFEDCSFDDSLQHIHATANDSSRVNGMDFIRCSFGYASNAGVILNISGFGSLSNCSFVAVAKPRSLNLLDSLARDAIVVQLTSTVRASWAISGSYFEPYGDPTSGSGTPQIQIDPTVTAVVSGNRFVGNSLASQILVQSSGVIGRHAITANSGGGTVIETP